jgi:hypothetical protein
MVRLEQDKQDTEEDIRKVIVKKFWSLRRSIVMSITRGHACISLSRIGLFSGSVFNLSSAQAAIMPEPAVEFNLNQDSWTRIKVSLTNNLRAETAGSGSVAWIEKKAFDTTIAIQMIPISEPATITILSIGLLAFFKKINCRWRKLTSCTYQEERRYEGRIQ